MERHCVGSSVVLLSAGFGMSMLHDPSPGNALFPVLSGGILFTVVWIGLEQYHVPVSPTLFAGNAMLAVCYFVFSYVYFRAMPSRALCVGAFVLLHMVFIYMFVSRICTPKAQVHVFPMAQETQNDITQIAIEVPMQTVHVID